MKEPKIKMSDVFKELDKYRNPSIHRTAWTPEMDQAVKYGRKSCVSWKKIALIISQKFGCHMTPHIVIKHARDELGLCE